MWVFYGLVSAVFLGLYDAVRKKALTDNPVLPVLFLASLTGAFLFIPLIILSHAGIIGQDALLYIPAADIHVHLLALLKSILVGSSWFLAYSALNRLPLTIVAPIRSTAPLWTLIGALIIFSERLTPVQWIGVLIVLIFFYTFSLAGRREGIAFHRNKWVYAAVGATILGAASSLYDKYLFGRYDSMFMQAWYSIYMVPVLLLPLMLLWFPKRKRMSPFRWDPLIHLIAVILVISDFLYFFALSDTESLISILSVLRRSSGILSFFSGALFFGERNLKHKGFALAGIFIGVVLIVLGTLLDS